MPGLFYALSSPSVCKKYTAVAYSTVTRANGTKWRQENSLVECFDEFKQLLVELGCRDCYIAGFYQSVFVYGPRERE